MPQACLLVQTDCNYRYALQVQYAYTDSSSVNASRTSSRHVDQQLKAKFLQAVFSYRTPQFGVGGHASVFFTFLVLFD